MTRRCKSGFSLVELLCVIAIILILVGLMMGPILRAYRRAKNFAWEDQGYQLAERFIDRMQQQFGSAKEYPALTVDQLYESGLIDYQLRDFLRDKRVEYIPFTSMMPDETVVLTVHFPKGRTHLVRKGMFKPPE